MNQKRGQFFILAAVILISIVAGITLYSNQVFLQDSSSGVKLIKEEVKEEGGVVINQYIFNNQKGLEVFVNEMASNLLVRNPYLEMIFFFRKDDNLSVFNLANDPIYLGLKKSNINISSQREDSRVNLIIMGSEMKFDLNRLISEKKIVQIPIDDFDSNAEELVFYLNGTRYSSDWIQSNRFYFLIKQTNEDSTEVADAN